MGQTREQRGKSPPGRAENQEDSSSQTVPEMACRKLHERVGVKEGRCQDPGLAIRQLEFLDDGNEEWGQTRPDQVIGDPAKDNNRPNSMILFPSH